MSSQADTISAYDVAYDVLPKLKATENLISNTLNDMIQQSCSEEERNRLNLLQQEFELEIMMIRMNFSHLFKRYTEEIQEVIDADGNSPGVMLKLDQHERFAIESARQLYLRAHELQTA